MKYLLFFFLPVVIALTLTNCEKKGTVSDIAKIKQADRAIKLVRNALEEYYLEHNTYPPQGANLKEVITPYVGKTKTGEGKLVSNWDAKIIPAFSEGPFYSTQDPKINYFVRAKANDVNKTPVSVRPSIIRKKEEEKPKKGK